MPSRALKQISQDKMKYLLNVIFILGLAFFELSTALDRKLSYAINPGCALPQCKNGSVILVHVKAVGDKDTLHHLWDFTKKPSVVLVLTTPNSTLEIKWPVYISGGEVPSVWIKPAPIYTYAVAFVEIIEFNDVKDSGALDLKVMNASDITMLDPRNFVWKVKQLVKETNKVSVVVEGSDYNDSVIKKNGTVQFAMSAFAATDHGETLPRLLHSGNETQIDVVLDKLSTQYGSSRFGLHIVTASNDDSNCIVKVEGRQTLDDEYAPGVFNIVEMQTPGAEATLGGFLQWRPVVYTSPDRDMTNSTESIQYSAQPLENAVQELNHTLVYSLLGLNLTKMLVVDTNVTFGVAGDGFFHKTNYAVWTILAGLGRPPVEKFSMLVTLVLSIGLGLPILLLIVGGICIFVRRLTRNKDDLFLSR